jgi:hypothetical protein
MLGRHTLGSGKTPQRRLAPLGPSPRGFLCLPPNYCPLGETLASIAKTYAVDVSMISRLKA